MNTAATIAPWVIAGVAALLAVLALVFARVRRRLERRVRARFSDGEMLGATTAANFFGQLSLGGRQIRGNGALVLTPDCLCFLRAAPEREYVIPLADITGLSLPRVFNGKSVLTPLLRVDFRHDGADDAMAWALREPQLWLDAIAAARRRVAG